ncbi:MAG: SPFH domain-containing protein [Oscillospiraceae bacterium]|nr:SPFH domain-containing protein [Oscillospiraceae bacterium]
MGLIKAALGSAGGVLADQWKDYFYCESLPADVLISKGHKRNSGRSSNTKGSDNIISNGSVININEGQAMIIVESGKIVDLCAEPGEYTYDTSTEPSLFQGDLKGNISAVFDQIGKRFTFGGEAPKDQRIYFFNTKEVMGNKYGTPSPVPFRVVDQRAGIDIDIGLRCFGEYSFKVVNPMLLYKNVAGNVEQDFTRQQLESQMRTELLTALQPAFSRISAMGIRYSAVPGHTKELADILREELAPSWGDRMGIEIEKIGMSSIKASEEDEAMLKDMQRAAAYTDPNLAMAYTVASRGKAMQDAANNAAGAATGFMGLGMMNGMGNDGTMQTLYQMQQNQQAQQAVINPAHQAAVQNGPGMTPPSQPAPNSWKCSCGAVNTGKFCAECGSPKPAEEGWTCACGAVNKGKFCPECGAKKPAGVPVYKCDKCGWEPEKGVTPPKFCPECGDRFDDGDII